MAINAITSGLTDGTAKAPEAQRFNGGKVDLTFNPKVAAYELAKVWMKGHYLKGYGKGDWKKGWGDDTINMSLQSMMRHVEALKEGELFDSDIDTPHAANIICNCCMILEHMEKKGLIRHDKFEVSEKLLKKFGKENDEKLLKLLGR